MKVAIISTCYLKQINSLYQKYSHLENLNNEAELESLLNYSASQFYYWKQYLKKSGVDIEIFCQDLTWINQKWAREQKISPLKKTKDSVLLNTNNHTIRSCFLKIKKIMDKKIKT